jgi:hypothetical protein
MDSSIILILAIILIAFIALNYYKSQKSTSTSPETQAYCGQTTFGCCSNGIDSKINFYGTNCPGYVPGSGYLPTPIILHPVIKPLPPPPQPVPPPLHPIYRPLQPPPQPVPPPHQPIYPHQQIPPQPVHAG